ncbi:MAG: STAS domain-containing protein [candidate division Zixibacteria bacterium]|nr:STAS domain-containing protein [candidate division Zixibacteria bacterium]MDD5426500.1 STAS domain-containing protein [candidate division Zixibacteria bacterium]
MDNISISLSESGPGNKISEVRIDGVIDTLTASELEEVIDSLVKRERYHIVIDLAGVDYISSAGWGIFISHIKDLRVHGGDIKLANMIPNVYEIYELLEFDNILQAFSSVDEARGKFKGITSDHDGLKKKDPVLTRVTVVDGFAQNPKVPGAREGDNPAIVTSSVNTDIEVMVLRHIQQDPFLTISEIKGEIKKDMPEMTVGWWKIFSILKKRGLLKKRSRFRYARGRF